MCGISGFINTSKDKRLVTSIADVLRDMSYFTRLRGTDAMGYFKVHYSDKSEVLKEVGDPFDLTVHNKKFADFIQWMGESRYSVAHNRLATRGEKKNQTHAQPFHVVKKDKPDEHIILVHNGTITNNRVEKQFPGKTDSHSIAQMLAAGFTPQELEQNLWGAYALVWYDSEDGSLNFFRNKERPLGFVYSTECILFSSELYMMACAADRNNIRVKELERLPVLEHWKYHHDGKWEKTKVSEKSFPTGFGGNTNVNVKQTNYSDGWDGDPSTQSFAEAMNEELKLLAKEQEENTKSCEPTSRWPTLPTGGNQVGPARVGVIPFHGPTPKSDFDNSCFYPKDVLSSKRYGNFRNTKRKPKYTMVSEGCGIHKGDPVVFSLADLSATKRENQTEFTGNLITYGQYGAAPRLERLIEVFGIIGAEPVQVDHSKKLWTAKVDQIYLLKDENKNNLVYRFHVKNLMELDQNDPFIEFQRSSSSRLSAVPDPKKFVCEKQGVVLRTEPFFKPTGESPSTLQNSGNTGSTPLSSKSEEREFADYKPNQCCSCGQRPKEKSADKLNRVTNGNTTPKQVIYICTPCLEKAVADDSRMHQLFQNAALFDQTKLTGTHH